MEAIFFDKLKQRTVREIDKATEEVTILVTDTQYAGKVTFKLSFYDTKRRPVYTEVQREAVDVELK